MTVEEVKNTEKDTETVENVEKSTDSGVPKLKGTILAFYRGRGYGFIKPEKVEEEEESEEEKKKQEVMVQWEDIVTDDPFPYIKKGTKVEYLLTKENDKLKAKEVTLAGGAKIPVFTKPYKDRAVNKEDTYKGTVAFYNYYRGWGMLKPDEEITWKETTTTGGLFFSKAGILTATPRKRGYRAKLQKGLRVAFKIYKDKKGLGACELKNEDETPIELETKEERRKKVEEENSKKRILAEIDDKNPAKKAKTTEQMLKERQIDVKEKTYVGRVKFYKPSKKFGFIIPQKSIEWKGKHWKRIFVREEDIMCFTQEIGLIKGSQVKFHIYRDSRGVGAYNIRNLDDTPIEFEPQKKEIESEKVKSDPANSEIKTGEAAA